MVKSRHCVGSLILALPLIAAAPAQQASALLKVPWWVWLILIAVFLLFTFGLILRFDWGQAREQPESENE